MAMQSKYNSIKANILKGINGYEKSYKAKNSCGHLAAFGGVIDCFMQFR